MGGEMKFKFLGGKNLKNPQFLQENLMIFKIPQSQKFQLSLTKVIKRYKFTPKLEFFKQKSEWNIDINSRKGLNIGLPFKIDENSRIV